MSKRIDILETRFEANIIKFEEKLKKMASSSAAANDNITKNFKRGSKSINDAWQSNDLYRTLSTQKRGFDDLTASVTRLAPALAAIVSIQGAIAAADSYTRFSNSLKVAGLEGSNLKAVQEQLFQQAQKNGTSLEALGGLYGKAAQSQKALGASQADLLRLTETVSTALRVSGTDAAGASGALLQLGQALGSGVVHAEEYNSVLEGMPAILQAAVNASSEYGGNLAKLKNDIIDGKVSSKEFFDLILSGSQILQGQAAKAPLTVAASMTTLQNAITKYIGEADASLGVTEKITGVIGFLANNLDLLTDAMILAATIMGARLVTTTIQLTQRSIAATAALVAEAVATQGLARGAATASVAMGGLRTAGSAVLGVFGGPLGLAVTAIATAFSLLAMEADNAKRAQEELKGEVNNLADRLNAGQKAARAAAEQSGQVGVTATETERKVASLTGEVDKLTDAYWRNAAAAKASQLEQAKTDYLEAKATQKKAQKAFDDRRKINLQNETQPMFMGSPGSMSAVSGDRDRAAQRTAQSEEAKIKAQADANVKQSAQNLINLQNTKLTGFTPGKADPVGDSEKPKAGGKSGSGANSADSKNRANERALEEARVLEVAAALANAHTEQERHNIRVKSLEAERQRDLNLTAGDKDLSADTKAIKSTAINTSYDAKVDEENKAFAEAQRQQQEEINRAVLDQLGIEQELALTAKDRHEIAVQQLAIEKANQLAAIESNDALDGETKVKLKKLAEENATLQLKRQERDYQEQLVEEQRENLQAIHDVAILEEDIYGIKADLAKTNKERLEFERLALESRQKREIALMELEIKELEARGEIVKAAQAKAKLAKTLETQQYERDGFERNNEGALDRYNRETKEIDFKVEYDNAVVSWLSEIQDGIKGVRKGTKEWSDVWQDAGNVVLDVISDILVKQLLLQPLSNLLSGKKMFEGSDQILGGIFSGNKGTKTETSAGQDKNLFGGFLDGLFGTGNERGNSISNPLYVKDITGGGMLGGILGGGIGGGSQQGGGWLSSLLKIGGSFLGLPFFANGVTNFRGGPAVINEKGGEIVTLPNGSSVIPHDLSKGLTTNMNKGMKDISAPKITTTQNIIVNAQDAVLTHAVKGWIQQAQVNATIQGAQGGKNLAIGQLNTGSKYRR